MRKRTKNKKHSCTLCKPHKTGHTLRWRARDLLLLRDFEKKAPPVYITPPRAGVLWCVALTKNNKGLQL